MNRDGKEIVNNMEILMKELHKEWDRSGVTRASVIISIDKVEDVNKVLKMRIANETSRYEENFVPSWDEVESR